MELLLNILWLMLALLAVIVPRRQVTASRSWGKQCPSSSFMLLVCLLALLFPVISATDDLHPIRAEIEESGPTKRAIKHAVGVKSPAWAHDGGGAARLAHLAWFRPESETIRSTSEYLPVLPEQASISTIDGRAPPEA